MLLPPPWDTAAAPPVMAGDAALINFYSSNTSLPGPLSRAPMPTAIAAARASNTPPSLRDAFQRMQYLQYAEGDYAAFSGAPVLPGDRARYWAADALPDGLFNGGGQRVEKCGCGKSVSDKQF
jgi:hypothetical protein